ncbi:hypothetical protein MLD38_012948 [Melastoma candidum]|uniref:Uncharacterized protein n=1 Tax=Melastoma candidum TaxID=119954 RepID=A0ACB9R856_9MYRT|nr:hypothetical protein MLD38_012948 [Melastoma candidum]
MLPFPLFNPANEVRSFLPLFLSLSSSSCPTPSFLSAGDATFALTLVIFEGLRPSSYLATEEIVPESRIGLGSSLFLAVV